MSFFSDLYQKFVFLFRSIWMWIEVLLLLFNRVADSLEKDLELQGVTGIEDKLQDGVNDTIEALQCAGIKVRLILRMI